jgi:putative ABC transport system substrate-binding protein
MSSPDLAAIDRRAFLGGLVLIVLAAPLTAEGQPATKIPRIGYLSIGHGPSATSPSGSRQSVGLDAFRQGLRELGYVEGQNILVEYRYADGRADRLPALAAELVGLRVDLIVAIGNRAVSAARQGSSTIPIVVAVTSDIMESGFVASLARPGGNVTGLTTMSPGLTAKRLELLKEARPKVSRVAVLWNSVLGKDVKMGTSAGWGAGIGFEASVR